MLSNLSSCVRALKDLVVLRGLTKSLAKEKANNTEISSSQTSRRHTYRRSHGYALKLSACSRHIRSNTYPVCYPHRFLQLVPIPEIMLVKPRLQLDQDFGKGGCCVDHFLFAFFISHFRPLDPEGVFTCVTPVKLMQKSVSLGRQVGRTYEWKVSIFSSFVLVSS